MKLKLLVASLVPLLIALRAHSELSMMHAHGPDAQMAIWYVMMLFRLVLWLVSGGLVALLVLVAWKKPGLFEFSLVALVVWAAFIGLSSAAHYSGARALADASSASTPPDRLQELASFEGVQAGYELDNRIASNPNTPPVVLQLLHDRKDQIGTEMCLARNPNTPDEILRELADRDDQWSKYMMDSLKANPRYEEVFGDRESAVPGSAEQ